MNRGSRLEEAVKAIESAILGKKGLKKDNLLIESNKVIVADGVKHEIDLYVQIQHGHGYDAVFIFECKDWSTSVGKNEIVSFSEKIKVTGASKGYFVATGFGRYALAQAKKDPKMVLLDAIEHPISATPFTQLRYEAWMNPQINFRTKERGSPYYIHPDLERSIVRTKGKAFPIKRFFETLSDKLIEHRLKGDDIRQLQPGTHTIEIVQRLIFDKEPFAIDRFDVSEIRLRITLLTF